MADETKCPQCGAPLPPHPSLSPGGRGLGEGAGVLEGLCPACLLKQGATADSAPAPEPVPFAPPSPEELGRFFPQLEILELLGRGGMGAVYKARQKHLDRLVALKILPPSVSRDPAFAERFAREAQALAKLNHPHIVTLYESGQADKPVLSAGVLSTEHKTASAGPVLSTQHSVLSTPLYYFLMEYVDGISLRQLLNAGRIAPKEALAIVPQICEALQFAHDRGIVHRDIKPENILLSKDGQVKIADFGVAKIIARASSPCTQPTGTETITTATGETPVAQTAQTEAGMVLGTPQYMAPEQVSNPLEVDHRADIYSLGVVFYQMLTGELPKGKFEPPSKKVRIDVRLDEVVLRALEKEPARRYQQAGEVKTMVETIAATPPDTMGKMPMPRGTGFQPVEAHATQPVPRFSRTAIVGACWAPLFLIAVMALWGVTAVPAGEYHGPAWWQVLLGIGLASLGAAAPFGTTILGWVAVSQILNSAGRLYGLGLAVADGLLFPLLALDGLIGWMWITLARLLIDFCANPSVQNNPQIHPALMTRIANLLAQDTFEIPILVTIVTAIVVDFLIIRWAWRAVSKPASGGGQPEPPQGGPSSGARLGPWALGLCITGVIAPILLVWWGGPHRLSLLAAIGLATVCEIAALAFGIAGWRSVTGKAAVIGVASSLPVLAVVLLILSYVGSRAARPEGETPPVLITGLVLDSVTGEPLVGARVADVTYNAGPGRTPKEAWTNATGSFALQTWPEEHDIMASYPGYKPQTMGYPGPGFSRKEYTFRLDRGQETAVRVVTDPSPPNIVVDVAAHPGGPWKAEFPGEAAVELVGVGERPAEGKGWWRPDGSPCERPYDYSGSNSSLLSARKNHVMRDFAMLMSGEGADRWLPNEFDPNDGCECGGWPSRQGKRVPEMWVISKEVLSDLRTISLRFAGQSRMQTVCDTTAPSEIRGVGGPNGVVRFSQATENSGDVSVTVSHNLRIGDLLVKAVGVDGWEHEASDTKEFGSNIHVTFSKLALKNIKAFRLIRLDRTWAEFRNTALQPGKKAEAQAETNPPAVPQPAGKQGMQLEILRVKLRQAEEAVPLAEARYKAGMLTQLDVQAAKDEVEILKAEIAGDPVQVARVRLRAAELQLQAAEVSFNRGLIDGFTLKAAKDAVEIRQIELRAVEGAKKDAEGK